MDDHTFPKHPQDEPRYPDLYARYKGGIHEVSIGINAPTDCRFAWVLTCLSLTIAAVVLMVVLVASGQILYSVMVLGLLLGAGVTTVAVLRNNAKNSKEPTDKSIDAGVGSEHSEPSRRIEE